MQSSETFIQQDDLPQVVGMSLFAFSLCQSSCYECTYMGVRNCDFVDSNV